MKILRELFNGVTGIVKNTPSDQNIEPDTKWFQDLQNMNQDPHHTDDPTYTAHYAPPSGTGNSNLLFDKNGKLNISCAIKALAQALYLQSVKPTAAGIDDVIHKLEQLITDYRDDLEEIPAYRTSIVQTPDATETLNNLIYGPKEPNSRLAVMVSDLSPESNLDIGSIGVDTNTATNDSQHDPPNSLVNNQAADRVNVVQPTSTQSTTSNDVADMLKDVAIKTAQLASLGKQKEKAQQVFQ